MSSRALQIGAGLALALMPATALAVNLPPVVDSVDFSSTPVPAGALVTIQCAAHDDSAVTSLRVQVSGGTLPGGGTSAQVAVTPGTSVVGSVAWTAPGAGNFTVTCTATDDGVGGTSGPKLGFLTVPANVVNLVGNPPRIDALLASAPETKVGGTVELRAAAMDPDGDPLTWTWTTSFGTVAGTGGVATYTAPSTVGTATVRLVVSDGNGNSATAMTTIAVRLALYAGGLPASLVAPRRIAAAAGGDFYVTDAAVRQLALVTSRGEVKGLFPLPETALSVAACWGEVVVGGESGRLYTLDPNNGQVTERLLAQGRAAWPAGMACDGTHLFIAEHDARRVRAVTQAGATALSLTMAGSEALEAPADVAVDVAGQRLLVLLDNYRTGSRQQLHVYTLAGVYVGPLVPLGSGRGSVTRGAGVAVGQGGTLYVADAFQGTVQVFDVAGVSLGELGSFGAGPGQLKQPAGVLTTGRGDVFVANTGTGRVEVFGQTLPRCAGDADCDGLPDAWETANGLDPMDPRDALADPDGDGLSNAQELAHGTNPRNRDTDGDGYTDGEEVSSGMNPLDPTDHPPVLVALSTVTSGPGLLQLDAQLQGRGTCSVAWTQVRGPVTVTLRQAQTATPSFVARAAGTYTFEGTPRCFSVVGLPAQVDAVVQEVAPRAEPGRLVVARAGEAIPLDAAFSWDGNGGVLAWEWSQTLGPPRLFTTPSAQAWVRVYDKGLYAFEVAVQDAAGQTGTAEVPALVVDDTRPAPTAMVTTPVTGLANAPVQLDASESVGPPGVPLQYVWRQVGGPTVALAPSAQAAQVSFVPAAAGRYRFEVSVREGTQASPWAAVDAYVAATAAGLPQASTPATRTGVVGEPLTLSGVQSTPAGSGTLGYRWRQVSGPAAGLTNATRESATVVPFSPGTAVFELTVTQAGMESLPALVTVETDVAGQTRPVASAVGPAVATAHTEVVLDGSASTGAGQLRHRWTQVAGPWVPLSGAREDFASFTPRLPGLYVFELEVDDGAVRSAPATVGVLVFPATAGGRP